MTRDPVLPAACTCTAIRQAARQVTRLYDSHLAPARLRATQYAILATLERYGPLAIGAVASRLVMDRTTTGRALRPLEREGLVLLGPGRDGRTRALGLTAAGRDRLAAAAPLWEAAQAAFDRRYGAADAEELRRTMARVVAAL